MKCGIGPGALREVVAGLAAVMVLLLLGFVAYAAGDMIKLSTTRTAVASSSSIGRRSASAEDAEMPSQRPSLRLSLSLQHFRPSQRDLTSTNTPDAYISDKISAVGENRFRRLTSKAKIIISTMQIISTFTSTYNVPWPQEFVECMSWFNAINLNLLNIPRVLTLSCVIETDFFVTWNFYVFGPILLLFTLMALLWFLLRIRIFRVIGNLEDRLHLRDRGAIGMIWVVYISYPACCRVYFAFLNCGEFDPGLWYLISDFSVECGWSNNRYMSHFYWAMIVAFVIPFGVPLVLWYLLHRHRTYKPDDRHGFGWPMRLECMQLSYKKEYWWCE
jgi:hypothetical protein